MSSRPRTLSGPSGFIEPGLPSPAARPPAGNNWIDEIKHDGFRLMARRDAAGTRLLKRNGLDWSARFPLIVQAVNHLRVKACLIDGEAVCCDDGGRKRALTRLVRNAKPGPQLNEHIAEPGDIVFRHACELGFEGIVSKRLGSRYRFGHTRDWIKSKTSNAPAVKREAEEDWGR